jgi:hypothetical protein
VSIANPFEFVAYCHKAASGNSVEIVAVKQINPGDQLFVSVVEHDRAMKGNKFVAKIYRLNKSIPEVQSKPKLREANREKLNFNLNLF